MKRRIRTEEKAINIKVVLILILTIGLITIQTIIAFNVGYWNGKAETMKTTSFSNALFILKYNLSEQYNEYGRWLQKTGEKTINEIYTKINNKEPLNDIEKAIITNKIELCYLQECNYYNLTGEQ